MTRESDYRRTFADIAVLYELSLAVGESLDLVATARRFVSVVMARKNLSYAGVWLRADRLAVVPPGEGDSSDLVLVHGVPRAQLQADRVSSKGTLWEQVSALGHLSVGPSDAAFAQCAAEQDVSSGAYALFALGTLGFLKLHSNMRKVSWSDEELLQLATVVRKFAATLGACLDHEKLVHEVAARERAEREREAMREALEQSQRLEAVGRLAGGVAHDFNNILTVILARAQLMKATLPAAENRHAADLEIIETAVHRAADLTGQLLAFSRRGRFRSVDVQPDQLVREVVRLFDRTLDPRITITHSLTLTNASVRGDSGRLESALLNLAVNACDAMPDGGTLGFETTHVELDEADGQKHGLAPGPYARICVSDTGVGMDPTVVRRIFEPFFTTKEVGKGTGLGLAVAYRVVMNHGGIIEAQSVQGQGSTLSVFLPLSTPQLGDSLVPSNREGPLPANGAGLVLVVDDQREVREALEVVLRRLGYEPLLVADGGAALDAFAQHRSAVRVVLLDVRMPGLSGTDTLRGLRQQSASVPVIIVSGFGAEEEFAALEALGVQGLVEKPFTQQELGEALASALKAATPSP